MSVNDPKPTPATTVLSQVGPLFELGRLCATPAALRALDQARQAAVTFIGRHVLGDWLDMTAHDIEANTQAVRVGERVVGGYDLANGERLFVITEADRTVTTLMLSSEY